MLTEIACRNAKPTEKLVKLSDGESLQLWIMPNGAKYWRLAYRFEGNRDFCAGPLSGRYSEGRPVGPPPCQKAH